MSIRQAVVAAIMAVAHGAHFSVDQPADVDLSAGPVIDANARLNPFDTEGPLRQGVPRIQPADALLVSTTNTTEPEISSVVLVRRHGGYGHGGHQQD